MQNLYVRGIYYIKMKYEPHSYQIHAIERMLEEPALGLLMDPGLGKTSCTLAAFDLLKEAGIVSNMLVICPLRPMYETWPTEVEKWNDFKNLTYTFLHGPNKANNVHSKADIYLINPEGLKWLNNYKWKFDMLVVDESTKFKNNKSKRFQMLKKRLQQFKRRYILTGTPAPNGLIDLWSQIYMLDGGAALGKYITHYRRSYFYPLIQNGHIVYKWGLSADSEKLITEKIKPITIRLDQKDYLKLPDLIIKDYYVDLPSKAKKIYKEMEKEFIVELKKTKIVTATNAAAMTIKIRQIANGGLYTSIKKDWENIHYEKAKVAAEIVDELAGKRVLISYDFKHDRERIMEELKEFEPRYIGGGVSAISAKKRLKDWKNGSYPVLLGHPASISHGLNLQSGNHIILHSLTWNLEDNDQFIQRLWRQGQKKTVFVYRIIARNTIDEMIIDALAGKARTQNSLLDKLRKRYL